MRYNQLMESTNIRVRDLNLPPDFWKSKTVWLGRRELISLDGCPDSVLGDFACWGNHLVSLEYAPRIVGRDFDCGDNHLTSLTHGPKTVFRDYDCTNNHLVSLEHAPKMVGRDFDCSNNHLISLTNGPMTVGDRFNCGNNHLTSLVGCPKTMGGIFDCSNNYLTSLVDIHTHIQKMAGVLYVGGNPITSHLLGILLIQGCSEVNSGYGSIESSPQFLQAIEILNKYLYRGREGIMDCQAEMLAAELDDFAQI